MMARVFEIPLSAICAAAIAEEKIDYYYNVY